MIDGLKPYPQTRPTGPSWLPMIPAHWDVRKLRHCGSIFGGMTPSMAEPSFWDGDIPWVSPKDMKATVISATGMHISGHAVERTGLKIVPVGSVLLVVRGMILARRVPIARTGASVTINQDMKAIVPSAGIDPGFLCYRLDAAQDSFVPLIDEAGHGTKRFPTDRWRELQFAFPPSEEQRLIVRFLDAHGALTARLIRAKERLIKLLEEQKQAIIHRAVTRGLDPNVRLKPSGIPWLGDVPEHWQIRRIKSLARINPSKSELARSDPQTLVSFLPMERVGTDGTIDPIETHSIAELVNGFVYFREGDIIVAKITPCFENGKGALLNKLPTEVGFGSTEFIVLRAQPEVSSRFLYLLTTEPRFRRLGADSMTGSAGQKRISPSFIGGYYVGLPSLKEQNEIVHHIVDATGEIRHGISKLNHEIALLREFRARLIADVVTGSLDVRAAAAALPEPTEIEPIDEPSDGEDLEETIDDAEDEEVAA